MKKLMLLAAMLAMVLVAAAPAFAQDDFEGGDVDQRGGSLTANNSLVQQCQNFFNIQNQVAADVDQEVEDVDQDGDIDQDIDQRADDESEQDAQQQAELDQTAQNVADIANVDVSEVNQVCAQAIAQGPSASATASASPSATARATTGGGQQGGGGGQQGGGGHQQQQQQQQQQQGGGSQAQAQLPRTGGGASLFALGAGALLVGGGLVARRIIK